MLDFFIDCDPPKSTAQASLRALKNKKTGKTFIGKMANSNAVKAKEYLSNLLIPFVPKTPMDGPIKLVIDWCYPFRKTEKKAIVAKGREWCVTRPDCDNLNKMFADLLTNLGFFVDDSNVADLNFRKFYSSKPGIKVSIHNLTDEELFLDR